MNFPEKLKDGDPFRYSVARKINEIIDTLRSVAITSMTGATFRRSASGTVINIDRQSAVAPRGGVSSSAAGYSGPFAIVKKEDGYAVTGGRYFVNGRSGEVEDFPFSSGWVYIRIEAPHTVTITQNGDDSGGAVCIAIGYVEEGKITQYYQNGILIYNTPLTIDPSLSALLKVEGSTITLADGAEGTPEAVDGELKLFGNAELPLEDLNGE